MRYLIDKKMDVIVLIAVDSQALKKEVQDARNAGIKVVAYDRLVTDVPLDLYITFDNEMVGRYMADHRQASFRRSGHEDQRTLEGQ